MKQIICTINDSADLADEVLVIHLERELRTGNVGQRRLVPPY